MIIRNQVICKDGTTLSVQASDFHYCTPRSDTGPWNTVEVGYFTNPMGRTYTPRGWKSLNDSTDIYSRVPIDVVVAFVDKHGGDTTGVMSTFI